LVLLKCPREAHNLLKIGRVLHLDVVGQRLAQAAVVQIDHCPRGEVVAMREQAKEAP
jgi:hypothetical protein